LPFAPIVYEQFTGQKVPQMSGTIVEMQTALLQISTNLQAIANNQQSLNQRLTNLENSANNLTHQFKNLRLTHTKERKEIEYNPNQITETEPENY
jgi:septal ring factor EnvC (AmiA/AmiB activator)